MKNNHQILTRSAHYIQKKNEQTSAMKFSSSILTSIISHISQSPKKEICGLLCGEANGKPIITKVISLQNCSGRESSFEIRYNELASYEQWTRQQGLEILAIYHSHPSGDLEPSFSDIRFMGAIKMPLVIFTLKNEKLTWMEFSPRRDSAIKHSYAV